jgi:cytoskeletal protein CcmA (bactofilin family)
MAKAATIIAAGTVVRGRVSGAEDLDLLGRIEGDVTLDGSLQIAAGARADASVSATNVYVHGILVGNATATDTIHLSKDAMAVGDLVAPRIIIDEGARIRGLVEMSGSTAKRSVAPVRKAPLPTAPPSVPEDEDDEPDLPGVASSKKVAVKKRS